MIIEASVKAKCVENKALCSQPWLTYTPSVKEREVLFIGNNLRHDLFIYRKKKKKSKKKNPFNDKCEHCFLKSTTLKAFNGYPDNSNCTFRQETSMFDIHLNILRV